MAERAIEPLYLECEAARMIGIEPRALRSERVNGRISYKKVAGRIMYGAEDLAEWRDRSTCRVRPAGRKAPAQRPKRTASTTSTGPKSANRQKRQPGAFNGHARSRGSSPRLSRNGSTRRRRRQHPHGTGPRRAAQSRIADVLAVYAQEHAAGHTAAPERTGYAINALLSWWGERTCDYIKPETCRAYVKARGVAESTAARELVVLRAALNYAHKNGKLVDPPFVEVPGKGPGRDRWLTRPEAARLLRESRRNTRARHHLPLFIMLALRTGARPGALFDLQWPQIDFANNRIDFNPPGRKRTNKQRPIIPIPRRLRWFLLRAHARATSPYVLSFGGRKIADIGKSFAAACGRAGLGPDVVPYTLRHSAGTWMAQRGVPLWQIGGWLGHSQEKTTELYSHHHPDHMSAARKVMD
jgi:integrase